MRNDVTVAPLIATSTTLASRPAGPQSLGQLAIQTARSAAIERLINRLVTDMPPRPIGERLAQMGGDLFRTPLQLKLVLHHGAQLGVGRQPRPTRPSATGSRPSMGQRRVIAAVVPGRVAAQLATNRRGAATEPAADLAHADTVPMQPVNP